MGDRTRTSPFRFFSGEFETRSPRKLPADQGQETGMGLTGWLGAGPEPGNWSSAPPTKLRIFPDTLTSCPCCFGPANGWLSRDGLAGPGPEIPFLSLVLTGTPLNFGIHAVQTSARKSSRNDEFSSGLAAFWFLRSAGGSVAPSTVSPGRFFLCSRALIKGQEAFSHKQGLVWFCFPPLVPVA